MRPPRVATWLAILALALAYVVAGRLALLLALPPGYATAVWPAAGIALGGLLIWGARAAPGVWLGSFAVNLATTVEHGASLAGPALLLPAGIATGAVLQALAGAWLIRRYVGFPTRLDHESDIGRFLFYGGPVSCLISATLGTLLLRAQGLIAWDALPFSWTTWWVGDSIGAVVITPLVLAWFAGPDAVWRRRRLWLTLPLGVTLVAVVALFVRASAWEDQRLRQAFQQRAGTMAAQLREDVEAYEEVLRSVADLRDAVGELDQARFAAFVRGPAARHPALRAISWDRVVRADERAGFEAARRAEGALGFQITERAPDGSLVRAGPRPSYVVMTYAEPAAEASPLLGYDVASDPGRDEALERARRSGRVAASDRVRLIDAPGEHGLSFYLPVVRAGRLDGFVTGVFHVGRFAGAVIGGAAADGIAVSLIDEDAAPGERLLYASESQAPAGSLHWDARAELGGRRWLLRCAATPAYLLAHRTWQAWTVLAAGLLFTGLLGGFLLVLTGRSARVERLVEERLAASESRFRVLLESAPDAIVIIDDQGRIGLVNAEAERLFGYSRAELVGLPVEKLVPELGAGRERRGVRKDGSDLPIEVSLNPIQTPDGPLGIAAIRDMTDRLHLERVRRKAKELEEQNQQIREANRLKNEFLANMSHELRTPLNGIIGFAELMHDGKVGPVSDTHKEYLGDILASSYHLLQLISDVLDLAKIEAGRLELRLEPTDLPALTREVTDVLRGVAAKNRVVICTRLDGELRGVRTDPGKVKQILYNYLSNAIKFTDRGGRIDVTLEKKDLASFRLAVEDTGIGVRPEDVGKLFSQFQQLDGGTAKRFGGTGLGLALTKRFAEALGGEVGVRSEVGKGSTFFVVLPLESQEQPHGG